jgi:DNA-binding CsgD family transcriptional regulator
MVPVSCRVRRDGYLIVCVDGADGSHSVFPLMNRPRHCPRERVRAICCPRRVHRRIVASAMVARGRDGMLLGRSRESEELDRLLAAVRDRRGRVLVIAGEPGIGKTALLEHAVDVAFGFQVARAVGVESEMELPFAALHQLCIHLLVFADRLPGPQRDALGVAFGLTAEAAPDRFLVGLAVLSLLSDAARERPLLCVVDDAQWMDQASAGVVAFVARRLLAEPVGILIASRESGELFGGLPEMRLGGLLPADARALLESALPVPIDRAVGDRILADSGGNPLALLELPKALTPDELAGGFGVSAALPVAGRIEEGFRRRLMTLPSETRQLLLVAAAEPLGDPGLVQRAAEELGLGLAAAAAAEAEGLIVMGSRVAFRHPLVRAAAYRAGSPEERRAAHAALGRATDPDLDPDRRAWHRAQAALGPDEDTAGELERSAGRAERRGGLGASAAFFERAAALSRDGGLRSRRLLAAAQAKAQAGAFDAAEQLLASAAAGPLDPLQRAQADLLQGRIAFALSFGSDAPPLLLKAARELETLDAKVARETYLEAFAAALLAGRLPSGGVDLREISEAALGVLEPSLARSAVDRLLEGFSILITEGHAAGTPALRQAVQAFSNPGFLVEGELRWFWLAGHAAGLLWDYEGWDLVSARFVKFARRAGALGTLPIALNTRAGVELFAGQLVVAESLRDEVDAVSGLTGSRIAPYGSLGLAVFAGREAEAVELIEQGTADVTSRGEGVGLTFIQWASAVLYNSLGRYEEAMSAALRASDDSHAQRFSLWALPELIEAAVRAGQTKTATDALLRLSASTAASGTDWAAGVEACSRALLSSGATADRLYREAIEHLELTSLRVALARARLVYGEWLRRERRRRDAREQLRIAHQSFSRLRMDAFAERARTELEVSGETARRRVPETLDALTPREAQIVRLAAAGATNREIGAQLFISPSTVDYHLRKAFRKLGVRSRVQLAHRQLLLDPPGD